MNIDLSEFDPKMARQKENGSWTAGIRPHKVHVFIGMRGSGKSTGMKHVMYSMRNSFDNGILMSATEEVNEFFGRIIPGLFTYQRYRPDVIKAFVKKQRKAKLRGQPLQRVFLILEDMMYDKQILRSDKWLAYLFQNGRHLQATLIISSQYAMSLPPEFRSQVDYAYCFMLNSRGDKEKTWDNFFGCFDEYAVFSEVYSQVCQDHGCLINDTTAKKQGIEAQCRFWKADERLPSFRLGNKQFWLHHVMYYDALADSDTDSDDGRGTGRKKRRVVNINKKHIDETRTKTLTLGT